MHYGRRINVISIKRTWANAPKPQKEQSKIFKYI
jgi:hypothetical protein